MTYDDVSFTQVRANLKQAMQRAMADAEQRGLTVGDLIDVLSDVRDDLDERLFEGEV